MSPIQIPPAGYEYGEARRRYVEHYGAAIMLARYQQIALVCLALVAIGLLVLNVRTHQALQGLKPLVIRIDEIGRATAVAYDRFAYKPLAPELKYFLTQFVSQHYSRVRATVRENYAASLYFLDGRLADATIAANHKSNAIETFLTDGTDEIEVVVKNVALEDLREPPVQGGGRLREGLRLARRPRGTETRAVRRALRVRREGPRAQRVHPHQPPGPHDHLLP